VLVAARYPESELLQRGWHLIAVVSIQVMDGIDARLCSSVDLFVIGARISSSRL
jgi:hypothetical protein